MTEDDRNELLKTLKAIIAEVLADDLGLYQVKNTAGVIKQEIPSIWVSPPEIPQNHSMKPLSGVEVIIGRESQIGLGGIGGNNISEDFQIQLTQYNLNKSLNVPAQKVINCRRLTVVRSPVIIPSQETPQGTTYSRAIISVNISYFQFSTK